MTPEQIIALVATSESEILEFKETTGRRREAVQTMCAMLNHRGGRVLFGVTPEGSAIGQHVSDHTLEKVSAEIQEIEPPVFPGVERIPVEDGREVVVVSVNQGPMKPYNYRGIAYRRVGNSNLKMSPDEYNQMLFERMHSEQRWENQPATGWSVSDLDVTEIGRTIEEAIRRGRVKDPGTREPEALLRGLSLSKDGELLRAAVVLFGSTDRIEAEMPQCLLRVARFRGTARTEFLDNRQFRGNAFVLLASAERFMLENLPVAGRIVPDLFERIDDPLSACGTARGTGECVLPPGLCDRRWLGSHCNIRRLLGGNLNGLVAFWTDRGEVVCSTRIAALESSDR